MRHMQQNICSPAKDIKTFTFTDSTGKRTAECWCTTEQVLLQTAITSVKNTRFLKKIDSLKRYYQRALFQTLVFTIVFKG